MSLDKIFKPKKIAVIGASAQECSVGFTLFKNLINSKFDGVVTPVNVKRDEVQGVKAYKSIVDIGETQDLAIIITPAKTVAAIMEECGQAGVGGAVVISAGFSEIGGDGEKLSDEVLAIAQKCNIRILGPNCLGFICPGLDLNASFAGATARGGNIAFLSQSGAICTSILDWANINNVGFSYFVSIGEMIDVGFYELISYFGADPNTSCIMIYMETLKDADKFIEVARAFSNNKPIVVLKAGRSAEGAKATMSHTGSLAGNDGVFSAAFERAGIIRVDTIGDLFNVAKILSMQSLPKGDRLAILTNAGGPGVIATDRLINAGGKLAKISENMITELNQVLPASWSKNNPIDVIGDADADRYEHALRACLRDDDIDAVLVILTPQAMTNPTEVAKRVVEVAKNSNKTVLASWMGGQSVAEGDSILEANNIPSYSMPEDAINAFLHVSNYGINIKKLNEAPLPIPQAFNSKIEETKELIRSVVSEWRNSLNETEAKQLLANYEIPVVHNAVAKNAKEAGMMAEKIGFPVVMKILSPDILHKIDVGGVVLNVETKEEAEANFEKITSAALGLVPDAQIDGIFIEQMVNKKYELMIGFKKDPIFGSVIVFGMGGTAVEVFKDIKVGILPLDMSQAKRLIEETKIYTLLKGFRNMPAVDLVDLQFVLYKLAQLIADFPEISEIDINPFAIDEKDGVVLDAKVILEK